ncbi:bifunctional DNA primase/polymerase [Bradyrhizobium ottawaense]|uniref:bifunctional DNA primase/polymerase n=1 Tax=Bradyrhizobium ottawaense TaxID=931866 RepID=UPI0030F3A063
MTSPYASAGRRLIDCGYSAIPVAPLTKRPGAFSLNEWRGMTEWQRFCDRLPTEIETGIWDKWPDAGVCVAIDHRLKVIDVDTDDHALMGAVLSAIPISNVIKRGAKGFSAFYRGSSSIVSQPFSVGKERVVDLLCHGRQTVLPPTIHPTTLMPYAWNGSDTLENTPIDQLPELPDDVAQRLETALAPFGYKAPEAYQTGQGDTVWRELNETALLNLDLWVPALGLLDTRRSGRGWRAVAAWRGVENANLSFHPDGIRDWGADESHTPINVVMKAFGVSLGSAVEWLAERTASAPARYVQKPTTY